VSTPLPVVQKFDCWACGGFSELVGCRRGLSWSKESRIVSQSSICAGQLCCQRRHIVVLGNIGLGLAGCLGQLSLYQRHFGFDEKDDMADHNFGFRTRALHAGAVPDAVHGSRAVPIYQTTSSGFESQQDPAALFALQKYGNIYSRISNPPLAAFEERMASSEAGTRAVATASGQAAEFVTFAALAGSGDHIVASSKLYGGTVTQLDVSLRRFGIDTTFVDSTEADAFAAAIQPNTKAIYTEIVANPSGV